MASYEAEQARLLRPMEEVELSEIEYDDELESEEEDSLGKRETDSESEQEISDIEDVEVQGTGNEMEMEISDHKVAGNEPTFIGKNEITQWSKVVPKKSIRIRAENKVLRLPISKLVVRSLKTRLEIFKYFIDNEMLSLIVRHTDIYISSIAANYVRERDASPTNISEIQALLGLLLKFLRMLSFDLIEPHLRLRAQMENIPRTLRSRLREICRIPNISENQRRDGETGRCSMCSSKMNRKT
ncbi:hypothetical protein JTB14_000819 [Gonioctena quinquepunctata]|nr:hypothetical protein JTB14_000819 [Gonioctena quinquepunctata]